MVETRYNEATKCWELVVKMPFSSEGIDWLKENTKIDGTDALVCIAFEEIMERFAVELAKTGIDKNIIAAEACRRGCGKIPIGKALGLLDPATS